MYYTSTLRNLNPGDKFFLTNEEDNLICLHNEQGVLVAMGTNGEYNVFTYDAHVIDTDNEVYVWVYQELEPIFVEESVYVE